MQTSLAAWLSGAPSIMTFLFLLGALIYVAAKQGDGSPAKTYAMISLCIGLFLLIAGIAVRIALGQLIAAQDLVVYFVGFSVLSTVVSIGAQCLMIAAVFVGRNTTEASGDVGNERIPVPSDNPYSPSAN